MTVYDPQTGGVGKQLTLFDYTALDTEPRVVVQQRTSEIKALVRKTAQDIIDIGQKLIEVKAKLQHGQFGAWLEAEFQWKQWTASKFMQVAEQFQNCEIHNFQPSALYLLAAPSTPEEARSEALSRAQAGEPITHAAAKAITAEVRRAQQFAEKIAKAPEPVKAVVEKFGVDAPEKVERLTRLHKLNGKSGSSQSFDEIAASGYIQPGDEHEAVHIHDSVDDWDRATGLKADIHREIGSDEKKLASHQLISQSKSNEWYTPAEYVNAARLVMGGIDLDPASCEYANQIVQAKQIFTMETDGLAHDWHGTVWLNPPYGRDEDNTPNQRVWSERLIQQHGAGNVKQAVMLVNAVTDRSWFQVLWNYPICFVEKRIRFYSTDTEAGQPTHGNVLVYFGENVATFYSQFKQFGRIVMPAHLYEEAVLCKTVSIAA